MGENCLVSEGARFRESYLVGGTFLGADPNAANDFRMTPLSQACTNGGAAFVGLLLKSAANPNTPIATGNGEDGLMALVNGKWVVLRVPYPIGFFAKGLDGRIDDEEALVRGIVQDHWLQRALHKADRCLAEFAPGQRRGLV